MSLWIYEDGLIWSNTRTLIVIQAGVLGGAYSLRESNKWIAVFVLALGILFTIMLYLIMQHHRQYRDMNKNLIQKIGEQLSQWSCDADTPAFSLELKPKFLGIYSGRRLLMISVALLIGLNTCMIIWLLVK